MSSTEFVGANRLSQVLASIKQAGSGTVADGKSIRINDSGQLELTGLVTGVARNWSTYNEYSGVFGINSYGLFKLCEVLEGLEESSVPQPEMISHLDNETFYTLDEVKEWVSNHGGLYLFIGSVIEVSDGEETLMTAAFFDLSAIINSLLIRCLLKQATLSE